jgi:uncharacterized heparinase superfamily protein
MISRAAVFFWSLYYLRPSMIFWRVHRTVKGALISVIERTRLAKRLFAKPLGEVSVSPIPRLGSRYHCEDIDLDTRRFSFLKNVQTLPEGLHECRVAVHRQPLLWQFHFGYHDYLLALLDDTGGDEKAASRVMDFIVEWDDLYPLDITGARRSAWHPYVLSIRIESWIRIYSRLQDHGINSDDARIMHIPRGVERMTRVLLRNLEKGTMANHLLRNIKALVFAGLFLDTPAGAQARRLGLKLLEQELKEQILQDGCHFERSPMYHVSVLNDVLDMAEAITLASSTVPAALASAAVSMTAFLEHMRHPDGEIPYFNDSTTSFFLRTNEVLQRGHALCSEMDWVTDTEVPSADVKRKADRESGLLTAGSARSWLVFDAGNVGPDYQPGHTHCDTLSFEWSLDGKRFITDTGVFHYRESEERRYSRSTSAHNTVEINGEEQSEIWKSFRVGRRAKIVHSAREEHDGIIVLRGAHDGYTRIQRGLIHERAIVVAGDAWVAVIDWLHGKGTYQYRNFLHFHPDVALEPVQGRVDITHGDARIIMQTLGPESLITQKTEYYPAFGEKVPRTSIILQNRALMPQMSVSVFLVEVTDVPLRLDDDGETVFIERQGTTALAITPRF